MKTEDDTIKLVNLASIEASMKFEGLSISSESLVYIEKRLSGQVTYQERLAELAEK